MISYKDSDKDSKEGDLKEEITYSPCKLEGWPVHSSIHPSKSTNMYWMSKLSPVVETPCF